MANSIEGILAADAWTARMIGIGNFVGKMSPIIGGIMSKIGNVIVAILAVLGIKWAAGDTAFYVGMGFISLLAFFAVYLYLR
jgi:hypothetical protein